MSDGRCSSDPRQTDPDAARRESERRLKVAFDRHHPFVDAAGDLVFVKDEALRYLMVNRAQAAFLGRVEDEIIGRTDLELLPGDLAELRTQSDHAALASEGAVTIEETAGGCTYETCKARADLGDGRLGVAGYSRDVSRRIQAEVARQESERRFCEMADLLPDMVFELDVDLRVTYLNRAVTRVLGYTQEDLDRGLRATDCMDHDTLTRAMAAAPGEDGQPLEGEYDVRCRDGGLIPTSISVMTARRPSGEPAGYRGVLRDVRERVKAQNAQRLAAVGQLAAGVAHEFNNLLTALMLQADLADQFRTAEGYGELLRTAVVVAARGADVCRDLMSFTQPAAPHREHVYVETVIDSALALAGQQIEAGRVAVTRDYQTHGRGLHADVRQLGQVFLNLVLNACHAMPQGGILTIATRHVRRAGSAGDIVVTVTDTGTGISQENLPRIFEPFFTTKGRLGDSGTPGTGLGLSVSCEIIAAHGGTINVASELGSGTTFELLLPSCGDLRTLQAEGAAPAVVARSATSRRPARALFVENGTTLSALIESSLRSRGYEVDCVHSTAKAATALQSDHYDLLIADLPVPGGEGWEALIAARASAGCLPVLMISGLTEAQSEEGALALGADGVLHKPFSAGELIEAVDSLLAGANS